LIPLGLAEVGELVDGELTPTAWADEITGVQIDSRRVGEGDLFVAVGRGADFCKHAFARGAAATLVPTDAFAALAALGRAVRDRSSARVVGITGSTGKTSTKDILAALCRPHRRTVAAERGFNNELGLPLTLCRIEQDTDVVIAEMGMRGVGQIRALCELARPEIGVITSVAPVHLELLGTLERVAKAKAELLEALPPDGVGIVPAGVPELQPHVRSDLDVRWFGPDAESTVETFEPREEGAHVVFDVRGNHVEVEFNFTARYHATNALAALLALEALGLPFPTDRVEVEFAPWRGQEIPLPGGGLLINDAWNANPVSMRAALEHLVERAGSRRTIAVLGDMAELGPGAPAYHEEIGRLASNLGIDFVFAIGPLAVNYVDFHEGAHWYSSDLDHDALVAAVRDELQPGDCVLVKGSRALGLETVADALAAVNA
jgi:UDP-N-acetylmuramoyl-tripeptide--D-alanyl-D-alanine ligase